MAPKLPRRDRIYRNHHLDSTRWDGLVVRDDDIVIATPYKCGTTWMQGIVSSLVLGQCQVAVSPWLDFRPLPLEKILHQLDVQSHRRLIKTHLPVDGLPYYPQVKYIIVSRDPRDVFMSLWNHYSNYTAAAYSEVNDTPGRQGPPQPVCPPDLQTFWHLWIGRGWFAWESEGYPFWSNMRHVQTWWDFRHLPNLLFVHYNHLQADALGQIGRIAQFLDLTIDAETLAGIVQATSLTAMRQQALAREEERATAPIFTAGARTFYYRGTNGRWKDALTVADLELYEQAATRVLTPACRAWLERGYFE